MSIPPSDRRRAPRLHRITTPDGISRCELSGSWNLQALEHSLAELTQQVTACASDERAQWDLRGVAVIDHAGAMLLWRAWGRRRASNLMLKPEQEAVFNRLGLARDRVVPGKRRDPFFVFVYAGSKVLS